MPELLKEGDLFLEKYRIERLIGQGGMGAVFAAVNEALAKRVAIKVLLPEVASSKEAANRFINEARASDRITGDHVARVFDVGQTREGLSYMVLEYLDGEDVSRLLETRGALPIAEAVDIILEALEGVAEAHSLGIVHRDLKPGNLFLAKKANGSRTVKVLDFGISKATNPFALGNSDHALTSTRSMLGSPLYMSPEQLRSSKSVDRRSDLWAIGVILYEMLAGVVPFNGESLGELFVAILEQPLVPIGHRRPEVPPQLAAVVHRCLERDPKKRVSDSVELAQLLAPFGQRSLGSIERIRNFTPPPLAAGATGATVALSDSSSGVIPGPPNPMSSSGSMSGGSISGSISGSGSASGSISGSGVHALPPAAAAQTNQSWAGTGGIAKPAAKPVLPFLIGGGVVMTGIVVLAGVFVIRAATKKPDPTAGSEPPAVTATAPPTPNAPAAVTTQTPVQAGQDPPTMAADAGTKVAMPTAPTPTTPSPSMVNGVNGANGGDPNAAHSRGTTGSAKAGSGKHTPTAGTTTAPSAPTAAKPPSPDDLFKGR